MHIFYKPPSKHILEYIVDIETYNRDSKIQTNKISYVCSISFIQESLKGCIINIRRKDLLLNNTKDHSPIEELTLLSGEIMNNLSLEVSKYGNILKVKNLKEVKKYWQEIKFKIEQTYVGQIVPSIIASVEDKLSDEKKFIEALHRDPFLHNYLGVIYGEYDNNTQSFDEEIIGFYSEPLQVKRKNKIIENQELQVISDGILEDVQNKLFQEKLNGEEESFLFNFTANYSLIEKNIIKQMEVCYNKEQNKQSIRKMSLHTNLK